MSRFSLLSRLRAGTGRFHAAGKPYYGGIAGKLRVLAFGRGRELSRTWRSYSRTRSPQARKGLMALGAGEAYQLSSEPARRVVGLATGRRSAAIVGLKAQKLAIRFAWVRGGTHHLPVRNVVDRWMRRYGKGKGAFGGLGAFRGMGHGWRRFLKRGTR